MTAERTEPAECNADVLQPEPMDLGPALATEESALIRCMPLASGSTVFVNFVIDVHGRARAVTVDGQRIGGAARCIRRALERVSFRGRRTCATTGEFVLAGTPDHRRSASGRAWLQRAHQQPTPADSSRW